MGLVPVNCGYSPPNYNANGQNEVLKHHILGHPVFRQTQAIYSGVMTNQQWGS